MVVLVLKILFSGLNCSLSSMRTYVQFRGGPTSSTILATSCGGGQVLLPGVAPALNLGKLKSTIRDSFKSLVEDVSSKFIAYSLKQSGASHLNFCEVSMRMAYDRLSFPTSFRDVLLEVATLQRYWMECLAYLDFMQVLRPRVLDPPLQAIHVRRHHGRVHARADNCRETLERRHPCMVHAAI